MDLSNEDAEKALLVQLADRNLISDEMLQKMFGFDPEMEKSRLNKENKDRSKERMIRKAGPWHDPQTEETLKKIALQTGLATPSQVDLELSPKKKGEKTLIELKTSTNPAPGSGLNNQSLPGQPGEGRPKNSKDTEKRKTKDFAPQTGASLQLWALDAQEKITNIMNPQLLEFYSKKNMRSLSSTEYTEAEEIKTKLLFCLEPYAAINEELLLAKLNTIDSIESKQINHGFHQFLKSSSINLDRALTAEEQKYIKAYFYSAVYDK
jgi:hypothetical protein